MKDSILDDLFSGDDGDLFNDKEQEILFEPRKLTEFKQQMIEAGKSEEAGKATEFDVLLDDLQGVHAEKMNRLLGNMNEHNFVNTYAKLLGYQKPKYKAIDVEKQIPTTLTQINVTIHRT